MTKETQILSTHIEKTAGSSLVDYIGRHVFTPETTFIYKPLTHTFIRYDDTLRGKRSTMRGLAKRLSIASGLFPYIRKHVPLQKDATRHYSVDYVFSLPSAAKHGHFIADEFNEVQSSPHFTMIVLRDPLKRMKSWFRYLKGCAGPINQRLDVKIDPRMTFREFAFHKSLVNWQAQALGNTDLADFDLVGTSERMPEFLTELNRRFDLRFGQAMQVPHLNRSLYYAGAVRTDSAFENEFKRLHATDYELHARANRMVDRYML